MGLFTYSYMQNGDEIWGGDYNAKTHTFHLRKVFKYNPRGRDRNHRIKSIRPKAGVTYALIVTLSNGDSFVLYLDIDGNPGASVPLVRLSFPPPLDFFEGLGDAVYVLNSSFVYVTRDTGQTWQVDSAGLAVAAGGFPNWLALDSAQYAYLAYSAALFKQHPDSNIWHKVGSFPGNAAISVFVDRMNRILASSYNAIYKSTDDGVSWSIDTAGTGNQAMGRFGDDAFGNLYALSGQKMWRSMGGTGPWTRIDQQISTLDYEGSPFVGIFNDIAGDTDLVVATAYGIFSSTDQGSSWAESNAGFPAKAIYGYGRTPTGRKLESTDLGIFYRDSGTASWVKTLPQNGFQSLMPIYQDDAGNLYTLLRKYDPATFGRIQTNWKSTDAGTSWFPDTAGYSVLGSTNQIIYGADENGSQHLANVVPAKSFVKKPGLNWAPDSAGLVTTSSEEAIIYGSDRNASNSIYLSTFDFLSGKSRLWKRPTSGGSWALDTAGLNNLTVYALAGDRTGSPLAGTAGNGVYRRSGGLWSKIPSPTERGVNAGSSTFVLSVDSSGAIIAGFADFLGSTTDWHGVYYTADNGTTWHYIGLDSIAIRGLVSFGDTTYAFTYSNGSFVLTHGGVVGVREKADIPMKFKLEQNYPNPFNPMTIISYSLAENARVNLRVYNALGQEVQTLINDEIESAGEKRIRFNSRSLATGAYYYSLQAQKIDGGGKLIDMKKMLLVK